MTINKKSSSNKLKKLSGEQQVANFLASLEHPLKAEIEEVRTIILSVNDEITEHIKWNAPSFCIHNQDRVTFNLHGKDGFRLIFHCGSKVTGNEAKEPFFEDTTKLLEWVTGDRAIVKFTSMNDVVTNKENLKEIVKKWIGAN